MIYEYQQISDLLGEIRSQPGYVYVATPYSKYPCGIVAAFEEACRATAWLVQQGCKVFCPIAHTHPVAMHGGIDPLDHAIWIPADKPLMDGASALVVVQMPGWETSYGITIEVEEFTKRGKPIFYLPWEVE